MRNHFDEQLEQLNVELTRMGSLCEAAIAASVKALLENDPSLSTKVFETDRKIDEKEREIEALCMRLLLQQQPVARDLRTVSSALKMISDMERIGDQASDIAEITKFISEGHQQYGARITEMANQTVRMVSESVESFVTKDLELVRKVIADDDIVDGLFDEIKKELIELIGQDKANGEFCVDLLMIAKYFERIGDHAVNIAEWVEYSLTGQHVSD